MPHYTATATAEGGRNGHVASADGHVKLDLTIPKEIGGPGKAGATNPEILFASGYAACFGSAIDHVAKMHKMPVTGVKVTAHVTLNAGDSGFDLATKLHATVHGVSHAEAEKLVQEAHQVCPYSKATRNNMPVEITVA